MHRASRISLIALSGALVAACGDSSGPAPGFECLGQALPTTAPPIITLTGQVRNLSGGPIGGAYVFAFRTGDATTLAADTASTPGFYSVSLVTGSTPVDGYLRATDSTHLSTYAYPAVPLVADTTENLLMVTPGEFSLLAGAAGITPQPGDGFIGVVVRNCAGTPIAGATVNSTPPGTVRYNVGGFPNSSATATAADGVAYIANVAAGNVTVKSTASGHTLRQHVVNARADVITLTEIRP